MINKHSSDSGKEEQERQVKVRVIIDSDLKQTSMQKLFKIIDLVLKFDFTGWASYLLPQQFRGDLVTSQQQP